MQYVIQSGKPISLNLVNMVMEILQDTHCPHEVFKAVLPDYKSFDGKIIQLDEGDKHQTGSRVKALFEEDEENGL